MEFKYSRARRRPCPRTRPAADVSKVVTQHRFANVTIRAAWGNGWKLRVPDVVVPAKTHLQDVIQKFNAQKLCRSEVSSKVVKRAIESAPVLIIARRDGNTVGLLATAAWRDDQPMALKNEWYIARGSVYAATRGRGTDVVCAQKDLKGLGKELVHIAQDMARSAGRDTLRIESIHGAQKFWTDMGFSLDEKLDEPIYNPDETGKVIDNLYCMIKKI